MQLFTNAFYAYDKEDKFLKTPWYAHLGVFAAGFANGALVGGFEKKKDVIFGALGPDNILARSGIDFFARGIGVTTEFTMASFAKSKYKSLSFEGFSKKAGKSVPKVFGYLLTTYY